MGTSVSNPLLSWSTAAIARTRSTRLAFSERAWIVLTFVMIMPPSTNLRILQIWIKLDTSPPTLGSKSELYSKPCKPPELYLSRWCFLEAKRNSGVQRTKPTVANVRSSLLFACSSVHGGKVWVSQVRFWGSDRLVRRSRRFDISSILYEPCFTSLLRTWWLLLTYY